jgi:tRNA A-37 threonylcarbamoyl transferase component Bud32
MSAHDILNERYRLEAPLGVGGMAQVYRAVDLRTGAEVAVKRLLKQHADNSLMRLRFAREVEVSTSLNHPNILAALDAGQWDGMPFCVTPLAAGGDLQQLLSAATFEPSPSLAKRVGRAVASALVRAHAMGVIHRDVKPHNVLVRRAVPLGRLEEMDFLLADFGMARLQTLATMTGSSLQWGSPAYMAPELLKGERADPRSDLFALGVLLYQICMGKLPWRSDAPLARLRPARIDPVSTLDDELDDLVMALLASEPGARPASANAVLAALEGRRALQPRGHEIVCEACGVGRSATTSICFGCGQQEGLREPGIKGSWHVLLRRVETDPDRIERLHALIARFSNHSRVSLQVVPTAQELKAFPKGQASLLPVSLFAGLDEGSARELESAFQSAGLDVVAANPLFKHKATLLAAQIAGAVGLIVAGAFMGLERAGVSLICYSVVPLSMLVSHLWARHTKRLIGPKPPVFGLHALPVASPITVKLVERLRPLREAAGVARAQDLFDPLAMELVRISEASNSADVADETRTQFEAWLRSTLSWLESILRQLASYEVALSETSEAALVLQHAKAERRLKLAEAPQRSTLTAEIETIQAKLQRRQALEHERDRLLSELCTLLEDPGVIGDDGLNPLSLALDRVALAMHSIEYRFDVRDHPYPPQRDYQELRALVQKRFPVLGAYNIAESTTTKLGDSSCIVGDAVDDVADIAGDLLDVEWRWKHTSAEDALWALKESFLHHWGEHLRCLQLYLHRLRDGL